MFNTQTHYNTRPDGFPVLEIGLDEGMGLFVPLRHTSLTGEVVGPLASLRLTQVFRFARTECDSVVEALYRFPLPGDAAVTAVCVRFGDVEIRADLKEREQAESDYADAKKTGRQAALLTRESPDVFTLQITGLQPDQDVLVETAYVQLARAEGVGWSLRVPLTTPPRYTRHDESDSRHAKGQPMAVLRDPGHRFRLDLRLDGSTDVSSPTHRLATTADGDGVRVQLADAEVVPDRDCVLVWNPVQADERPGLKVSLHDDAGFGHVYFLARLTPPKRRDANSAVPREVVLLVDHSGSMHGAKWEAADWAVKKFLSELTERDAFTLGLFHDRTRWLSNTLRPGSAQALREAVTFLETHRDDGGTELGVALEQALAFKPVLKGASRHVLVLTDAEVTDSGRILRLADDEVKKPDRRRIDVLCIDAAPNAFLANELAERSGGVSRFLTSDPQELDVTTALDEVLQDWSQPVLTGLRLEVSAPSVEAAGRAVIARNSIDLGDLPIGRSVWLMGRVPRGSERDLGFRVLTADGREVATCRVDLGAVQRPALKALFGVRRVNDLEFLINAGLGGNELTQALERLGYDAGDLRVDRKLYAENAHHAANAALKKLLAREALRFGLASSETAFVAVRTEAGRLVEGAVVVANALPARWSERFVGGPLACMATPAPQMLLDALKAMPAKLTRASIRPSAPRRDYNKSVSLRAMEVRATPTETVAVVFAGRPTTRAGEVVLFDSTHSDAVALPEGTRFVRLRVEFPEGTSESLDVGLTLTLYVGDLATPVARVRLADLMRFGGDRPLNVTRSVGQTVRLVLLDPAGVWVTGGPALKIALHGE